MQRLEISVREEHGFTVVSDRGVTAQLMALGDRPVERVVPSGDAEALGRAVGDIRAFYTGVALLTATKAGKVELVTPTPMSPKTVDNLTAATMAAAVNGHTNGHTNGTNGHAHPHPHDPPGPLRDVAGVPDVLGWRAKPVESELERLVGGRILWRLRRAGVTTVAEARDLVLNEENPSRQSKFIGASVIESVAKALRSAERRALKAVAGRRGRARS